MNLLACTLTVILVADTTPTEAVQCARGDHACHAAMYTTRAESATTPAARAKYHEAAHRSFVALYDQTRRHEALCAARRSLERTAKILGKKTAATQLASLRQKLAEREVTARPNCTTTSPGSAKKTKALAQRASERSPDEGSPTEPAPAAPVQPEISVAVAPPTSTPVTQAPAVETPTTAVEPAILLAVPIHRTSNRPTPGPAPADPAARRLLISGGVTIGVGVGLATIAGYAGARLAQASRESFDLYADNQGRGDAAALAQEEALRQAHARWLPITVTTAALSGTAVVVGAILVAVGKRQAAAVSSRAALLPMPGGLAIRARF